MSDIVFLRAWYPVLPKKFYNPVTSLLLTSKKDWQGMKLSSQVRREQGIPLPINQDSTYKVWLLIVLHLSFFFFFWKEGSEYLKIVIWH